MFLQALVDFLLDCRLEQTEQESQLRGNVHFVLLQGYLAMHTGAFEMQDIASPCIGQIELACDLDGHFADLKNKLRNHNGLNAMRRQRFVDEFLKASGPPDEVGGGTA